jgi:hypothetical protein
MIQIPWLTRMRRLAISLVLLLVLVAVALPASAAAPEGIEGEVTVVNGADQPVPITGEVTADVSGSVNVAGTVTVGNEATNPVPVSGDVTADVTGSVDIDGTVATTQSGAWTVGLDAAAVGHLSDIDDATAPLTYDASGNLNVNVAAESLPASEVQTASELTGNKSLLKSSPPTLLAWASVPTAASRPFRSTQANRLPSDSLILWDRPLPRSQSSSDWTQE